MYIPKTVQGHIRLTFFTQVSSKDGHDMSSPSVMFTTMSKNPEPPTLVMTAFLITSAFGSTSSSKPGVKKQGKKGRFRVAKLTCGGGNPAFWLYPLVSPFAQCGRHRCDDEVKGRATLTIPFLAMAVKPVCFSSEYYSSFTPSP